MFRSAQHDMSKKNREENKFSSRVEVRVVTPKAFGAVDQAWGVNASFSSLIFSLLLFFLRHRLIPPFHPQHARNSVKSWE